MTSKHLTLPIFDADDPPVSVVTRPLRTLAHEHVVRVALISSDHLIKDRVAQTLHSQGWAVINHLDPLKDDLVHWLMICRHLANRTRAHLWERFCEWVVVDEQTARKDLAYLLDPLFEEMLRLATWAADHPALVDPLADRERLDDERVAFINDHGDLFQSALNQYAVVSKELTADDLYLVDETVTRSLKRGSCVNTDTHTHRELDVLRHCGWVSVYLYSDASQPNVQDISETLPGPSACDLVIDGRFPLGRVLFDLTDGLLRRVA